MYDIAIIGDGTAGLSAAINARARNKNVVVIGRGVENSAIYKAEKVNNYIGIYNVSGKDLIDRFYEHALQMGVEFNHGRVQQVFNMGENFSLNVENNILEAKTVIIATGMAKGKNIVGEAEYIGKGVSYCATCDGMLYKDKPVVVIGEIEEAENDVAFLSEICQKVWYLPTYGSVDLKMDNVEVVSGKVEKIIGDKFVSGIIIGNNTINCSCVFIIKKSIPLDTLIDGLAIEKGAVVINKNCETNIAGIFACGDVTGGYYQVAKAVGEGQIAGLNASKKASQII